MRCPETHPCGTQCSLDEGYELPHELDQKAFCLKKCPGECCVCVFSKEHSGECYQLHRGELLALSMNASNSFLLEKIGEVMRANMDPTDVH